MKKLVISTVFTVFLVGLKAQIIADHTVVDQYDQIPDEYLNKVKTMLVEMAGESHSSTFNYGSNLLEQFDSKFQSTYFGGTPPAETTGFLRIGKIDNVGEETYFASSSAIDGYKARIANQNNTGNVFDVMGFVWCWDMYYDPAPGGGLDPVYNVHWGGTIEGGPERPEGIKRWGLDSEDTELTGNSVSMDTYLNTVLDYQQYCIDNGWGTKIIFTTGPVDDTYPDSEGNEDGVQREIKHNYIREFVNKDPQRILFDYADILCWNNAGEKYEGVWNDGGTLRYHAHIHPDNTMDYDDNWNVIQGKEDGDHIGEVGSLRIMKAMWWMLARIAGWEGVPTDNGNVDQNTVTLKKMNDRFIIELRNNNAYNQYSIYNIKGSQLKNSQINSQLVDIPTGNMQPGVYFISLSGDSENRTLKVVID
ncbi:T9SS type A sorting domain-containing protein [Carboxylicivirga caseinilyticus]|uniref:T9SS type A sorting domain-containing protein n=1 Tax=Carboxylicivirga caseinilyticus TaxID=3417572 RepID=UPI003D34B35A|nr:T9SS type A sorting domain-containing protein [Marinilabiliaceae bacterium A049]